MTSEELAARPDELPAFEWSLPLLLLRAREAVMQRFRPILSEFDVTEQQWRVLRVLADEVELPVTQVADRCVLLGPSVTRIVRALEDKQLIGRRVDRGDRRRVLLSITPAGLELLEAVVPHSAEAYAQLFDELGSIDTERLLGELEALAIALEASNGSTTEEET